MIRHCVPKRGHLTHIYEHVVMRTELLVVREHERVRLLPGQLHLL